ncbi:MAG: lysine exporter LysO family protein [Spirochaetales bacterium]|nr:lysine exporter LysO family protein [Spirochaetales bacterium]
MDSLIQILVLLAFMVAGALICVIKLAPPPRITDAIIKVVLWALLFVMGFRLGNERGLRDRLGEIGLLGVGTAVATLAGTILAVWLAYALLDALSKRQKTDAPVQDLKASGHSAGGLGWVHFRGPAILLAVVVLGFVAGAFSREAAFDYGRVTGWVLNALLFMIGMQFAQSKLSLKSAFVRVETVLVPAATIVGTLAGGLVVALVFRLSVGKALALSAGFGWYTLSGVLISDLGDPVLGSAAFLSNMARESLAFILIPLLSATKRPYAAIGVAGATAMDVTLPLVEQCLGPDSVPVSFTSGAVLSMLVPVLVPLFFGLPF